MSYGTYPSSKFLAVTPSDTAKLLYPESPDVVPELARARAIYVGGAGDLEVANDKGGAIVFAGVAAGSIVPVSTDQVLSTNTTATNIVALF